MGYDNIKKNQFYNDSSCFFRYKYGIHDIHTYREMGTIIEKLNFFFTMISYILRFIDIQGLCSTGG